jgi:ubiquinone/menaquinone biosynthesis C-methylase UbiE
MNCLQKPMSDEAAFSTSQNNDLNLKSTEATRARYGRIAPVYDLLEILPEIRYRPWREQFWKSVTATLDSAGMLLEVGVGTGKNMPFWPRDGEITAIELAPAMLKKAAERQERLGKSAELRLGDVQALDFPTNGFDIAVATFVFCSVPDPILGLKELRRVVRPGGWIFLMEHVRAQNRFLGMLMDLFNPIVVRTMGPNINCDIVGNVLASGLEHAKVDDLGMGGIFKLITARVM